MPVSRLAVGKVVGLAGASLLSRARRHAIDLNQRFGNRESGRTWRGSLVRGAVAIVAGQCP